MYIHLGGERIIRSSELVAIFDVSIEKSSKISKQFVSHACQQKKRGIYRRRRTEVDRRYEKYGVLFPDFLIHTQKTGEGIRSQRLIYITVYRRLVERLRMLMEVLSAVSGVISL